MRKERASNFYETLQVSPRADQEVIERAYRVLAKRFHPDNHDSGDAAKFGKLTQAFEVLSDPEKRAAYDEEHRAQRFHSDPPCFDPSAPEGLRTERKVYQTLLFILYVARRRDVVKAGVGIVHLERLTGLPSRELEFHLWYLKEKGWIQRLETGELAITASGVDAVMKDESISRDIQLLPMVQGFPSESEELNELTPSAKSVPGNGSGRLSN